MNETIMAGLIVGTIALLAIVGVAMILANAASINPQEVTMIDGSVKICNQFGIYHNGVMLCDGQKLSQSQWKTYKPVQR